jgi:hypothetical protein
MMHDMNEKSAGGFGLLSLPFRVNRSTRERPKYSERRECCGQGRLVSGKVEIAGGNVAGNRGLTESLGEIPRHAEFEETS